MKKITIKSLLIFLFAINYTFSLHCDITKDEKNFITSLSNINVIIDVGAFTGEWTKMAKKQFPKAQLIMFEPNPKKKKELKNIAKRLHCQFEPLLISNTSDALLYYSWKKLPSLNGIHYRNIVKTRFGDSCKVLKIPSTTLDSYCATHAIPNIDLLKIDTEGNELKVLLGASNLLKNKKIETIQFEYGGTYIDAKITLKQVYLFLTELGYEIFKLTPKSMTPIPVWENALEDYEWSNFVARLKKQA